MKTNRSATAVQIIATAAAFCWAATQATAWEFTPGAPCLLTHATPAVEVTLTYDPTTPLYSISFKQAHSFPTGAVFGLRFNGALPLAIGTDRQRLSEDNTRLTVEDSGFGNVLNGLQFNDMMVATIGAQLIAVPLAGATDPVAAFRACESPLPLS